MKTEKLKCKDCNAACSYRGITVNSECTLGRTNAVLPDYIISDHNLKIYDSFEVKKKDFKPTLVAIEEREPNYAVWNRGKNQMCLEWACHNACYFLNIKRSSTKDVDFEFPQAWYIRWAYAIIGCLVWIFIP